jgi:hypothetical protein
VRVFDSEPGLDHGRGIRQVRRCRASPRFSYFMLYFNFKNYKANHAMSENEQYYDSIGIVCVRA